MNRTTEHAAKTPLTKIGLFATLRGLLRAKGSGAPSTRRSLHAATAEQPHLSSTVGLRRQAGLALASIAVAAATLALTALPAQAAVQHKYLCQITGAGSASTSPSECDTNANPAENPAVPSVESQPEGRLSAVTALTLDSGHLWLAESFERTRLSVLNEFDASSGAFLSQPAQGADFEELNLGIAVGHATGQAEVYVGHPGAVAVFDEAGTRQADWTGADTPSGSLGGEIDVAVDSSTSLADWAAGDVYVADPGNKVVDVFKPKPTGGEEYVAQITETEPGSPFSGPAQIAVDNSNSNGDIYVADGASVVDVFEPTTPGNYTFLRQISATPSGPLESITDLAADGGNGDIYVRQGGFERAGVVFQFNSAGNYVGHLASTPTVSLGNGGGIAVDPATHHLYLGSYVLGSGAPGAIDVFGPNLVVPDVTTEPVSNPKPTSATLKGTVDADSSGQATCQFAWGTSPEFGHVVPCTAPVPDGNSPVPVEVDLELQPDTTYFYRLQAENANGLNEGEPAQTQEFTTPGPGFHSTSVSAVSADSATLEATIDPNNAPTTYYFQYGTDTGYGTEVPAPPGTAIGSGEGDVEVSQHFQGLLPSTAYHYRVLALSELSPGQFETFDGPDRTFTTQPPAAGPTPPDGRAWELVSPPDKHGTLIERILEQVVQASTSGEAMTYVALGPTEAEPQGNGNGVQILSTRGPAGWSSHDIPVAHEAPSRSPSVQDPNTSTSPPTSRARSSGRWANSLRSRPNWCLTQPNKPSTSATTPPAPTAPSSPPPIPRPKPD